MYYKIKQQLQFAPKREYKLTTPCCNKSNSDGKFVNYKGLPLQYGYCHSCGVTKRPPQLYRDESGNEYIWNSNTNIFEEVTQTSTACITKSNTSNATTYYNAIISATASNDDDNTLNLKTTLIYAEKGYWLF